MQRQGGGLHCASSCYWDNQTDGKGILRVQLKPAYNSAQQRFHNISLGEQDNARYCQRFLAGHLIPYLNLISVSVELRYLNNAAVQTCDFGCNIRRLYFNSIPLIFRFTASAGKHDFFDLGIPASPRRGSGASGCPHLQLGALPRTKIYPTQA